MSTQKQTYFKKITVDTIKKLKNKTPIVMITAYDALFAKLFDGEADIILVGDSLNMTFNAKKDTLSIDLDTMIYHTNAVCRGSKRALVVLDMPFGTYSSKEEALKNAVKVLEEALKIYPGRK